MSEAEQVYDGDCFETAGRYVLFEADDDPDLIICHGVAVLQRGPHAGDTFWHAWVEKQAPQEGWRPWANEVIDRSNGHDYEGPAALYYAGGQIQSHTIWRFTQEEGRKAALKFEHWGPWVEGWSELTDH